MCDRRDYIREYMRQYRMKKRCQQLQKIEPRQNTKSNAERMKEYRARKKKDNQLKRPKTNAERVKEYRERMKLKKQQIEQTSNWSLNSVQGSRSNAEINDADYVSEDSVFKIPDDMIDQEYIIPESLPNTQRQSPIDSEIKIKNEINDQGCINSENPHNTQQQKSPVDSTIKIKDETIDPTYNPSQSLPNTQQQQPPVDPTVKMKYEITDPTNISLQNPPSIQQQQSSPEDSTLEVKDQIIDHNYTSSQNLTNTPNAQPQQPMQPTSLITSNPTNAQSNSTNESCSKIKRKRSSLTRILLYSQKKLEKMETIEIKKFKLMEERNNLFATSLENIATTLKNVATTLEDISIKLNRKN